ncbi:hypothetical protein TNCT_276881 [Trichonephila clavata]|uniref:Uncharacterized protein n=1 Tax=Trichonephila clavata TaxID=2740835 RepID=A0A8X6H450_TRICU|nr:hypothetical protein TNCT_276881 [Trichonephila clavata]
MDCIKIKASSFSTKMNQVIFFVLVVLLLFSVAICSSEECKFIQCDPPKCDRELVMDPSISCCPFCPEDDQA